MNGKQQNAGDLDPNETTLFGGISGAEFSIDRFDFGEGIILRKTYAHLIAPYLMAFEPPEKGKPHPPPWRAVQGGGFGYDVTAELQVPKEFSPKHWFDRLNTIWWFAALFRLNSHSLPSVPVVSNESFSTAKNSSNEIWFWAVETSTKRLDLDESYSPNITMTQLIWIKEYWKSGGILMNESPEFNLVVQAFDRAAFSPSAPLTLLPFGVPWSLYSHLDRTN